MFRWGLGLFVLFLSFDLSATLLEPMNFQSLVKSSKLVVWAKYDSELFLSQKKYAKLKVKEWVHSNALIGEQSYILVDLHEKSFQNSTLKELVYLSPKFNRRNDYFLFLDPRTKKVQGMTVARVVGLVQGQFFIKRDKYLKNRIYSWRHIKMLQNFSLSPEKKQALINKAPFLNSFITSVKKQKQISEQ